MDVDTDIAELAREARAFRDFKRLQSRESFLHFASNPALFDEIPAPHHVYLCTHLDLVAQGLIKRLMIFMPPGSAKSTYASIRFPSWYMGRFPNSKFIAVSHTATLANRFGRRVRNLIDEPAFAEIFPGCRLSQDSQAKGDWSTAQGGEYFTVGFDGAMPGRRADGLLIDDPIKGIKEADSETIRDNVWDRYVSDLRPRLRVGGGAAWTVIIQTRWHQDDLAGRILPEDWNGETGWVNSRHGELWYVLNLPMEAEEGDPIDRDPGQTLWPEWFTPSWVAQEKLVQGTRSWNALFQGKPSTEEGAIIKQAWWRKWPSKEMPVCQYVMQCYDTAFEEEQENDYSARTTWGIFDILHQDNAKVLQQYLVGPDGKPRKRNELQRFHAILLEAWRGKVQFPDLKDEVRRGYKTYDPDMVIIEKKASGISLIQELRRSRLRVRGWPADRDKRARLSAASDAFKQGCVWYADSAESKKVIRECAEFPAGEYDDWADTVAIGINYLRTRYHLQMVTDEDPVEEPQSKLPPVPMKPVYG